MPPHTEPTPDVYRGMVDVAPDAMVAVDTATGGIRLANTRAEQVFGWPRDELVGRSIEGLVPRWFQAGHRQCFDTQGLHRAGHEFPVEVAVTPLSGCGGTLVAASIRDVSERHAIREASERMRDELIATVSHELRTPLTSILGYTEILVDMGEEAVSEHAARLLGVVRRNAQRELKLVEDLLTLAFLGTSSLVVDPHPTDLAHVARGVLEDLATFAVESGIELVSAGLDSLWVVGDPQRLGQVLSNLVTNAIKFTPTGGRVEVRLLADEAHGILEVEDQGMGVSADELPRVFERLYRAPEVVAAHLPGAGLGLPIVKGIVDAHDGEIDVESQPGQGTKVQVRLPLVPAALAG